MQNFLRKLLRSGFVAFVAFSLTPPVLAGVPNRFIVFGDSLSDPGNAFVILRTVTIPPFESFVPSAPYARGALHFSNGPTWVEQLSLIDRAVPSAGPALLVPRVLSNYAVGGARARLAGPFDLTGQINRFLTDFQGTEPADALYVLWIGGDDLRDAVEALAADHSGATSVEILQQAIGAIQNGLLKLYGSGARNFLVLNAPDIGLSPEALMQGAPVPYYATTFSYQFNLGLEQVLTGLQTALGVSIVRVDVFALLHEVVAAPSAFGLTNVSAPCIALSTIVHAFCSKPNDYLFWDGIHPTVAGHNIVAERASAALGAWPH